MTGKRTRTTEGGYKNLIYLQAQETHRNEDGQGVSRGVQADVSKYVRMMTINENWGGGGVEWQTNYWYNEKRKSIKGALSERERKRRKRREKDDLFLKAKISESECHRTSMCVCVRSGVRW